MEIRAVPLDVRRQRAFRSAGQPQRMHRLHEGQKRKARAANPRKLYQEVMARRQLRLRRQASAFAFG